MGPPKISTSSLNNALNMVYKQKKTAHVYWLIIDKCILHLIIESSLGKKTALSKLTFTFFERPSWWYSQSFSRRLLNLARQLAIFLTCPTVGNFGANLHVTFFLVNINQFDKTPIHLAFNLNEKFKESALFDSCLEDYW